MIKTKATTTTTEMITALRAIPCVDEIPKIKKKTFRKFCITRLLQKSDVKINLPW